MRGITSTPSDASNHGDQPPGEIGSLAASWLERLQWQSVIFAEAPRRADLARLRPSWPRQELRLRVHRNYPFELVSTAMAPFLAYAGLAVGHIAYSGYDDSLPVDVEGPADAEIVTLDFERYRHASDPAALAEWLKSRLTALRSRSDAPILVTDWPASDEAAVAFNGVAEKCVDELPGVRFCRVSAIEARLGERWRDARLLDSAGTDLSGTAVVELARHLALRWLPAVLLPPLKAIVVDLDNTLYEGVLAEDGAAGLVVTEAHAALQRTLVEIQRSGILLGVLSRNDREDVRQLFEQRPDFVLRPADVSAWAITWAGKEIGLKSIAQDLRIATDALLVIDDNPGELAAILAATPATSVIFASDPVTTTSVLQLYPRLFKFAGSSEDALRAADLAVARQRVDLATATADVTQYLESLDIELTFAIGDPSSVQRVHELSVKTNQFNTALRRFSEGELARRLRDGTVEIVVVGLRDRLSDSGVIASVIAERTPAGLRVEEVAISCRALGRGLEDVVVAEALRCLLGDDSMASVEFDYQAGNRNRPALDWLARFAAQDVGAIGTVSIDFSKARADQVTASFPAILRWASE